MKVLVIDTSSDCVSIACGEQNATSSVSILTQRSSHSENILKAIEECLKDQGLKIGEIEAIGLGIGPGMFTGLRVGITAAHSISHAIGCPIVPMSSLELAALSHDEGRSILIAKDARRHEVYCAQFNSQDQVHGLDVDGISIATSFSRSISETLISPSELVERINGFEGQIVLDDPEAYSEFEKIDHLQKSRIELLSINPQHAIEFVQEAVAKDLMVDTFTPKALYLRKSDAELSWGKPK